MRKLQVVVRRDGSSRTPNNASVRTVRNVRYSVCQKNQAVSVGGHAVDGCNEFIARGAEGTAEALTCAACGCHRRFHKREVYGEIQFVNTPPPTINGA